MGDDSQGQRSRSYSGRPKRYLLMYIIIIVVVVVVVVVDVVVFKFVNFGFGILLFDSSCWRCGLYLACNSFFHNICAAMWAWGQSLLPQCSQKVNYLN